MHDKSRAGKGASEDTCMQSTFHIPIPATVLTLAECICVPKPV